MVKNKNYESNEKPAEIPSGTLFDSLLKSIQDAWNAKNKEELEAKAKELDKFTGKKHQEAITASNEELKKDQESNKERITETVSVLALAQEKWGDLQDVVAVQKRLNDLNEYVNKRLNRDVGNVVEGAGMYVQEAGKEIKEKGIMGTIKSVWKNYIAKPFVSIGAGLGLWKGGKASENMVNSSVSLYVQQGIHWLKGYIPFFGKSPAYKKQQEEINLRFEYAAFVSEIEGFVEEKNASKKPSEKIVSKANNEFSTFKAFTKTEKEQLQRKMIQVYAKGVKTFTLQSLYPEIAGRPVVAPSAHQSKKNVLSVDVETGGHKLRSSGSVLILDGKHRWVAQMKDSNSPTSLIALNKSGDGIVIGAMSPAIGGATRVFSKEQYEKLVKTMESGTGSQNIGYIELKGKRYEFELVPEKDAIKTTMETTKKSLDTDSKDIDFLKEDKAVSIKVGGNEYKVAIHESNDISVEDKHWKIAGEYWPQKKGRGNSTPLDISVVSAKWYGAEKKLDFKVDTGQGQDGRTIDGKKASELLTSLSVGTQPKPYTGTKTISGLTSVGAWLTGREQVYDYELRFEKV